MNLLSTILRILHFVIVGISIISPLNAETPSDALTAYSASLKHEFPDVSTITPAELARMDPPPLLLDAREKNEFAVSHLPGALRVENDPLAQLQQRGVKTNDLIVVYCSVGYRSSILAQKLKESGFANVRNLEGSIFAWANEGRPLVNADGPTEGTHPFNIIWGRYLDKTKWRWKP